MLTKLGWKLLQLSRALWMRTLAFAILAVLTALVAIALKGVIPASFSGLIGAEAVDKILSILASSMLAVTTFSLSVMVSAHSAAANNLTPRATRLMMEDSTTQNALATFVGSFVFSLVGIIALSSGLYGEQGRIVLFIVTIAVVVLIVGTILLWINHLARLSRVSEIAEQVEVAACSAIVRRGKHPWLDANRLDRLADVPKGAYAITATEIGYIQHIDIQALNSWAKEHEVKLYVVCLPGSFVHDQRPILYASKSCNQEECAKLQNAITIGDTRSFDQDPRFGLLVMAEIASRALSPGINDPGTAIEILGRGVRLISKWRVTPDDVSDVDVPYPYVWVPRIDVNELFVDFFSPIARDGAGLIEVQIRVQKSLAALSVYGDQFNQSAGAMARTAMARAEQSMSYAPDIETLREVHSRFFSQP
ncbi:DUF2254 domain-containing protein [Gilvimarinus sp. SDUM040013]|uniref:DUF2254 domain-containing protein n=1 Tax=Gilvimarinus gilvus TaxID=3058038 RepID=A0ABU4RUQ6_9GAMM|nr:DUF2254 domain-containing protein [Gilvimarinus sp. SDUM040013]MDO3388521.1 DUF2254 domain-containing protein [Gilvimarinus sp. SDUM040013]MDX6848607.1 DUF2254 domain-containing protein [Gilvimarinus sp. SDUM040013]